MPPLLAEGRSDCFTRINSHRLYTHICLSPGVNSTSRNSGHSSAALEVWRAARTSLFAKRDAVPVPHGLHQKRRDQACREELGRFRSRAVPKRICLRVLSGWHKIVNCSNIDTKYPAHDLVHAFEYRDLSRSHARKQLLSQHLQSHCAEQETKSGITDSRKNSTA